MAMTVLNNSAAMMTLGELNKNISRVGKDLSKIAKGEKILGGGDGASDYAISEKMRTQIRALRQDIRNTQNGRALINVALGGAQDIVDELRCLKELALNSCNDHNTDADRAILQKDFDARKAHIDSVANETNYNNIPLLDGRWKRIIPGEGFVEGERLVSQTSESTVETIPGETITDAPVTETKTLPTATESKVLSQTKTTSTTEVTPSRTVSNPIVSTSTDSDSYTEKSTVTLSSDKVSSVLSDTTEGNRRTVVTNDIITSKKVNRTSDVQAETTTTATTRNITDVAVENIKTSILDPIIIESGTTSITEDGLYEFAPDYTGTLTISATNVQLNGPSNGSTLNDIYIVDGGVEDLYIKNLNVVNTQDISTIAFDSSKYNMLHVLGKNSITTQAGDKAIINAGGGLNIVGDGSLDICLEYYGGNGAKIGSDRYGSCGDISIGQNVNLSIITNLVVGSAGAGIGSGWAGTCGNIYIGTNANVYIDTYGKLWGRSTNPAIGSAEHRWGVKGCGDIVIYSGAKVKVLTGSGAGIGTSFRASECGNITVYSDAEIDAFFYWGAGIGTGTQDDGYRNVVGNITIYSYSEGDVIATSHTGDGIGYGRGHDQYNIIGSINLLDTYNHTEGGVLDLDELSDKPEFVDYWDVTTTVTEETEKAQSVSETRSTTNEYFDEIENIVTTSVYEHYREEDPDKPGRPLIIHTGTKANQNLPIYIEDMRLEALGVKDTKISDIESAKDSLDIIDAAIDYALDEATNLGAYYNRLEFTESNLTAAHENTTSAESVIRDADMAKEMTSFTKNNILAQASQSMLAQANQTASGVLGLLQ